LNKSSSILILHTYMDWILTRELNWIEEKGREERGVSCWLLSEKQAGCYIFSSCILEVYKSQLHWESIWFVMKIWIIRSNRLIRGVEIRAPYNLRELLSSDLWSAETRINMKRLV
jgi:hypothetical protein